ncbi:nucleoside 2-deoxyribosyltransferase [Desulfosporosinus acididurans]|uniref:Nucleoside 2-deoxyribosyltransferase n=1 Tax=Desulfosporosinus acididurans TaxID=476652 RepID=A0A0J1FWZ3_9FIRM|nr:hypothetical protein [Desulfosporosinus acididurans]KLU67832.1 nucleoside 2-deoxyribosyltransferase [Desulfosporosinus acididurans]
MACAICDNTSASQQSLTNGAILSFSCPVCGEYAIHHEALSLLNFKGNATRNEHSAKISAYLRNRYIQGSSLPIICLNRTSALSVPSGIGLDQIIEQFPRLIFDRLDLVLLNLAKLSAYSGDFIKVTANDYSLFYADKNNTTAQFYIMKQLIDENLIELKDNGLSLPNEVRLTPKGWGKVAELELGDQKDNKSVFIAMSFDPSLITVYENSIAKAISDNGYNPIRVDYEEHIEQISDRIIADIRRCKYVVADFTFNRGGVYYEAGFAIGLGKPVIWTCREDHVKDLHFDTRQYNHIVWVTENDLYDKLDTRIKAIF